MGDGSKIRNGEGTQIECLYESKSWHLPGLSDPLIVHCIRRSRQGCSGLRGGGGIQSKLLTVHT